MDKYLLSSNKLANEPNRWPFALRKATDCNAKGRLLQAKRRPFISCLIISQLQIILKSFPQNIPNAVGMPSSLPLGGQGWVFNRRHFGKLLTVRRLAVNGKSPREEGFLMVYFERHCPCRLQYSRA